MTFIKYGSIENSYNQKYIDKVLESYPGIESKPYLITEKIHGANFSMWLFPDGTVEYAKRTSFLKDGEKFFDHVGTIYHMRLHNVITRDMFNFNEVWRTLHGLDRINPDDTIVLYGEFFGDGVQRGVDYNVHTPNGKDIKFFDIVIIDKDGEHRYLSPQKMYMLVEELGMHDLFIRKLDLVDGLQAALDYNSEFDSSYNPVDDNICEGIVIRPYGDFHYDAVTGTSNYIRFALKKKNDEFLEKANKAKRIKIQNDPVIQKWQYVFKDYINKNRVESLWSKHGPMESMKQTGLYVKELLEDAKIDFIKDCAEELEQDNVDVNACVKRGGKIAGTLIIGKFKGENEYN